MITPDEKGRPAIKIGHPDERNERERWVIVLDSNGRPESLLQEYEIRNATQGGSSYVRPGRMIPAEEFFTAVLADEVRAKLYKFLQKPDA
jgi:hypothetical protein